MCTGFVMQNHLILTGINRGLRAQSASQLPACSELTPPLNISAQVEAAVDYSAGDVAAEEDAAEEEATEEEAAEEEDAKEVAAEPEDADIKAAEEEGAEEVAAKVEEAEAAKTSYSCILLLFK